MSLEQIGALAAICAAHGLSSARVLVEEAEARLDIPVDYDDSVASCKTAMVVKSDRAFGKCSHPGCEN